MKQYFLKLDQEMVDVGGNFLRAFDILFQSHYVFNVTYDANLESFYSFVSQYFYGIGKGTSKHAIHEALYVSLSQCDE